MNTNINEKKLRQIFKNESDCYADTWHSERGFMEEGEVIQAMTEDRFIEVIKVINFEPINSLTNKLKKQLINSLKINDDVMNDPYLTIDEKTYTKKEIINEIQNETEIGIKLITNVLMATIDYMSRS